MTDENNALKDKEQVKKTKSVSKTTAEKRKNTTRKSTTRRNYSKNEEKDSKEVKVEEKPEKKRTAKTRNTRGTKKADIFKKSKLKIIPLGGLHEIGKNITLFEYEDEIIIVDCGISFPEDDMLGLDLVIPDVTYLIKNQE